MNPDIVLIGESDSYAGDHLSEFYKTICENDPPIARMNFANAELTKLALNTYITTKISYANMLGEICECLPEADVDVVTRAVGLDSRVGQAYFRAGTRYGGPCFPRDNRALGVFARSVGVSPILADATESINDRQHHRLVTLLEQRLSPKSTVAILGLAYKTGTGIVDASQGVTLASTLLEKGFSVTVYDPLAMENARKVLDDMPVYASSVAACVAHADAVVVTLPDREYRCLRPKDLKKKNPGRILILDCWRLLDKGKFEPFADYMAPGLGTLNDQSKTEKFE
jgi:UDPglucose 6-dehydrogenase